MGIFSHPPLVIAALLSVAVLPLSCGEALDTQEARDLGNFQIHQAPRYPGGFPPAWAGEFSLAMIEAPDIYIADSTSVAVVRDLMLQLKWVDPRRLRVEPALPEGIRVYFEPLWPRLAVSNGDRPIAMLADATGTVLPDGISEGVMRQFIRVPIDSGVELPPAGQIPADPVIQEAFKLWPEADQIAINSGLNIVAIQRKSTYPRDATDIAPAMSFILDTGVEITWGRARDTPDPMAMNSRKEKLTMLDKGARLIAVLMEYPDLAGVGKLVLDEPEVKVFGPRGERLPLKAQLR